MSNITEIVGGKQYLFEGFHELQEFFEEHLSKEHRSFIRIPHVIENIVKVRHSYKGIGRRSYEYQLFFRAFFAQNYFRIPSMTLLIKTLQSDPNLRQLCGFKRVPSIATFSRRLKDLSDAYLMDEILEKLVKKAYRALPAMHLCRDSSVIAAREKVVTKERTKGQKEGKKRGRPSKNVEKRKKEVSNLEKQLSMAPKDIIKTLNQTCSWTCKTNSQGKIAYSKGYKLHLDVSDIGFPISAIITGANVHDSQVAIPLEKMSDSRLLHFYSLMDSAYDAEPIYRLIRRRHHVPIIDPNVRNDKQRAPLDPAKQERYKIRTTVERSYSHLKDRLLPQIIYVKGCCKVSFFLMIGVILLAALKCLQYFPHQFRLF